MTFIHAQQHLKVFFCDEIILPCKLLWKALFKINIMADISQGRYLHQSRQLKRTGFWKGQSIYDGCFFVSVQTA